MIISTMIYVILLENIPLDGKVTEAKNILILSWLALLFFEGGVLDNVLENTF